MKKIFGLLMLSLVLFTVSCDLFGPNQAGDVFIEITPSTSGYVWESDIEIIVTVDNEEKVNYVKIFVDNVEIIEDHLLPFSKVISTNQWQYGEHTIKSKAYYDDDSRSDKQITVSYICCPIFEEDLININGITETNAQGELIGNIDESDWHFGDGVVGTTFGPAFPNPCQLSCSIQFNLEVESTVSIIIINSENEIIEVLLDNSTLAVGGHYLQWTAPENVNDIFRVIFHADDDFHWHGDVEVQ